VQDVQTLIEVHGEPVASTSPVAQHHVFSEVRRAGISVILSGQGADEIFAGYVPYLGARLASLLRQGRLVEAVQFLLRCRAGGIARTPALVMYAADCLVAPALQVPLRKLVCREAAPQWFNMEWFRERRVAPSVLKYSTRRDALRHQLACCLQDLTLPHLLRYEDRNSMAFSVESRVPFLTPKLVSYVLSLPEEYLVSGSGRPKAVLREAMRGIVPDEILDRRDKVGFATPEKTWLTSLKPWVQDVLNSASEVDIPVLDFALAKRDCRQMLGGQRRFDARLWRWINLIKWSQRFSVQYA
jgi:asparagine synthase (glutamine-hydrolysing)